MTDREWAQVRAAMPVPGWLAGWLEGRGGQPESYCHRQMIDAIRFLVENGIKWRATPVDFPAWHRVYVFFRRWRDKGLVTEFHVRLRGKTRAAAGRGPEPTAGIIDSQSVKAAASVPASSRGFDGGKKINGRKRAGQFEGNRGVGQLKPPWTDAAQNLALPATRGHSRHGPGPSPEPEAAAGVVEREQAAADFGSRLACSRRDQCRCVRASLAAQWALSVAAPSCLARARCLVLV
ncbi:transposase [Streptomyces sp. NPDC048255]|uniref:transposase n=1 Tax=Streptomyces sp. NPDC048255 TaxID=3154713 RepID=UPI0033DAFBE8